MSHRDGRVCQNYLLFLGLIDKSCFNDACYSFPSSKKSRVSMCAPKSTAPVKQRTKPTWISSRKACSLTTSITGESWFHPRVLLLLSLLNGKRSMSPLDGHQILFHVPLCADCRIVDNMPVTWCYDVEDNQKFCNPGFPIGCYVTETGLAKDACVVNVSVFRVSDSRLGLITTHD